MEGPKNTALTWSEVLHEEKQSPYFKKVVEFVNCERQRGKIIYPASAEVFQAFKLVPFDKVSVVILGQDPYHGPNQAHGLSFSVKPGCPLPPSLKNIFLACKNDQVMVDTPSEGDLSAWCHQGVLLLNSILTVEQGRPQSHHGLGWETFTDFVIRTIAEKRRHVVFMLWGMHARKKSYLIGKEHLILESVHPSPLSAHRGFLTANHFARANDYLSQHQKQPIDWSLA